MKRGRPERIARTLRLLEDERIAGILKVSNTHVQLHKHDDKLKCGINLTQGTTLDKFKVIDSQLLIIRDVSFRISDNYIYDISIIGYIEGQEITISNKNWSLSLKNHFQQSVSFWFKNKNLKFCFSDVFRYQHDPSTGAYSYYVQDAEFNLKPGEEKVLYKRSLNDYLSINIANDFLGINTGNSNNLITTDFNAILPLNVNQRRFLSMV